MRAPLTGQGTADDPLQIIVYGGTDRVRSTIDGYNQFAGQRAGAAGDTVRATVVAELPIAVTALRVPFATLRGQLRLNDSLLAAEQITPQDHAARDVAIRDQIGR